MSGTIPVIQGDLLMADKHNIYVIVQQTNCCTIKAQGLAMQISVQLDVNPYIKRRLSNRGNCAIDEDRDIPGTVNIMKSPYSKLYVANIFAQYAPGPAGKYSSYPHYIDENGNIKPDTPEQRLIWFRDCCRILHEWAIKNNIKHIGVPYMIGCGLAGGNWNNYYNILQQELPETIIFYKT